MTLPSEKVYPENQEKICTVCLLSKLLDEFSPSTLGRFGRHSQCKGCKKKRRGQPRREYYKVPIEERFWKHVQKTDGCWIWTGAKLKEDGYGVFGITDRERLVSIYRGMTTHRFSWELHFGSIPDGLMVCHHCDNPPCVRPYHLFLGTAKDNVDDMFRKGRAPQRNTKLEAMDVTRIRKLLSEGFKPREIAETFGVHPSYIYDIRASRRWSKVA